MRLAFPALRFLRRWDAKAAASAHRYLANSSEVQQRIKHNYGIDATILHPPAGVRTGPMTTPANAPKPGYLLCVARLVPYKHVDVVAEVFRDQPLERLVVVGDGPMRGVLRDAASPNVTFRTRCHRP